MKPSKRWQDNPVSMNSGLPGNFGRAFDLGSLKKPAVELDPQSLGYVVTQQNLMSEALKASNATVIVLICWSPRSAQSQELLATTAKLHEADSTQSWVFASLNVDAEPEVAQALQVKAIPFALALVAEQLVPLFEAVPPVEQISSVISRVVELAAEKGVGKAPEAGSAPEERVEPEEEQAMAALEANDFEGAKAAYRAWLNRSPNNTIATLGLAQVELLSRVHGVDFGETLARAAVEKSDLQLQMLASDIEIALGQYEAAYNRMIEVVRATSGDERKAAREHLLALFLLIDPTDPILIDARKRLANALF